MSTLFPYSGYGSGGGGDDSDAVKSVNGMLPDAVGNVETFYYITEAIDVTEPPSAYKEGNTEFLTHHDSSLVNDGHLLTNPGIHLIQTGSVRVRTFIQNGYGIQQVDNSPNDVFKAAFIRIADIDEDVWGAFTPADTGTSVLQVENMINADRNEKIATNNELGHVMVDNDTIKVIQDGTIHVERDSLDIPELTLSLEETTAGKALDATLGKILKDNAEEHGELKASTTELGHVKIDDVSFKVDDSGVLTFDYDTIGLSQDDSIRPTDLSDKYNWGINVSVGDTINSNGDWVTHFNEPLGLNITQNAFAIATSNISSNGIYQEIRIFNSRGHAEDPGRLLVTIVRVLDTSKPVEQRAWGRPVAIFPTYRGAGSPATDNVYGIKGAMYYDTANDVYYKNTSETPSKTGWVLVNEIATASKVGLVKPDGTTITIDSEGTISASGTDAIQVVRFDPGILPDTPLATFQPGITYTTIHTNTFGDEWLNILNTQLKVMLTAHCYAQITTRKDDNRLHQRIEIFIDPYMPDHGGGTSLLAATRMIDLATETPIWTPFVEEHIVRRGIEAPQNRVYGILGTIYINNTDGRMYKNRGSSFNRDQWEDLIPTASVSTFGLAKVDGETIRVSNSGALQVDSSMRPITAEELDSFDMEFVGSYVLHVDADYEGDIPGHADYEYAVNIEVFYLESGDRKVNFKKVTLKDLYGTMGLEYTRLYENIILPVDDAEQIRHPWQTVGYAPSGNGLASSGSQFRLLPATDEYLGGVIVDGETIVVDEEGVISAVGASDNFRINNHYFTGTLGEGDTSLSLEVDEYLFDDEHKNSYELYEDGLLIVPSRYDFTSNNVDFTINIEFNNPLSYNAEITLKISRVGIAYQ